MTKQNEYRLSNFWIGFSLGIGAAVSLVYLLGTKKGREMVKKTLRFSENIEENLERYLEKIDKQSGKKGIQKGILRIDNIEEILTKIKQVTNNS